MRGSSLKKSFQWFIAVVFTSIIFLSSIASFSVAAEGRAISVTITTPEEMESVSALHNITGTSSGILGWVALKIDVDNLEVGPANQVVSGSWDNWYFEWNTRNHQDGVRRIDTRTFADVHASVNVTIGNTGTPNEIPTVEINSPSDGGTVSGGVTIEGGATDSDGNISEVEIRIDDGPWRTAQGTTNWQLDWDTTSSIDGTVSIRARSIDDDLEWSVFDEIQVTVANGDENNTSPDSHSVQLLSPMGGEHWMGYLHTIAWTHDMPFQCIPLSDVYYREADNATWRVIHLAVVFDRIEWFHNEATGSVIEYVVKVEVKSLTCGTTNVSSQPFTVAIPSLTIPEWPEKPDGPIVLVLDPAAPNETLMPDPAPLNVYNESFWINLDLHHDQFSIVRIPPYWPLELAIAEYQPVTIILSGLGLSIWDQSRSIWGAGEPADLVQDVRNDIVLLEYLNSGGGLIVTHDTLSDWGVPGFDYLASSGGHLGISDDYKVEVEMNLAVELGLGWIPIFEQMKMSSAQASSEYKTLIQNAPLLPSFVPFSGDWNVQSTEHPLADGVPTSSHIDVNCPVLHDTDNIYCDGNGLRPYTMIGWQMAYPDVVLGMMADSLQESVLAVNEWGRMAGMDVEMLSESLNTTAALLYSFQANISELRNELPWVNVTIPAWSITVGNETIQVNETYFSIRIPDDMFQRLGPAEIVAISDDNLAAVLAWEDETHRAVTFTWKPESTDNNETRQWMANSIAWTGNIDLSVAEEESEEQDSATSDDQADGESEDSISIAGMDYSIRSFTVIVASVVGVLILLVIVVIVSGRRGRTTDGQGHAPNAFQPPNPVVPLPMMPPPPNLPPMSMAPLTASSPTESFTQQIATQTIRVSDHTGLPGGGSYTTEDNVVRYHDPSGRTWFQLPDGGFELQPE